MANKFKFMLNMLDASYKSNLFFNVSVIFIYKSIASELLASFLDFNIFSAINFLFGFIEGFAFYCGLIFSCLISDLMGSTISLMLIYI